MTPVRRFLFVMVEGGGNVPAQLTVARRLVARGHEVHVLSDAATAPEAERAGCRFHPFVHAPHQHMSSREADRIRDWEATSPIGKLRRTGQHLMFGPAAAHARDVLDACARIAPDAVAVDCLLFGAMVGAEKSGLPSAVLFHFPYHALVEGTTPIGFGLKPPQGALGRARDRAMVWLTRRVFAFGLPPVNAARRELGLSPLPDVFAQFHQLPRSLVLTTRRFDFVPSGLPAAVRYVGPQLDDPAWPAPWTSPWPADARDPLVVVSLGSTYQAQDRTFARIVEALGQLPVRGLATLGALPVPTDAPPSNVRVVPSAPHGAVLPLASAVVCHGGHGTVMKALSHGLPVVVMPFGRDQLDNAARVEVAGAGLQVSPGASPARIAAAVQRVLHEPSFARAARDLAADIARDVAGDRASLELESLAAARADAS